MAVKLLVVGGGKMGQALITGLLSSKWADPDDLGVIEPNEARRTQLAAAFPELCLFDAPLADSVSSDGGALLAVKPDAAEGACRVLGAIGVKRVVSVVAGMPTARLEVALGDGSIVIRAMPNTPALIGKGVTAISGGEMATSADLAWAEEILSAVGTVVRLPERHLDAVTGLSGSGPAYVFLVAEALIEAGVLSGLDREVSRTLVTETLVGSAALLAQGDASPESLRAAVTSPGGTTAAGLRALEARAVRSAFMEAVAAAAERSRNLHR
jgi:pyrroline-5-carboxylate reductase